MSSLEPNRTAPWESFLALGRQIGGTHYKKYPIQPIEYCFVNNLGPTESYVVKYITRWRDKGGFEDLRKIQHLIDVLIELESKYGDGRYEEDRRETTAGVQAAQPPSERPGYYEVSTTGCTWS